MADAAPPTPTEKQPTLKVPASKPLVVAVVLAFILGSAGLGLAAWHHFHPPAPAPAPPAPPAPPVPPPPTPDPAPLAKVSGLYFPLSGPAVKGPAGAPLGLIRVSAEQSVSKKPIRWKVHGPAALTLTVFSPDGGLGGSIAEAYPTVPGTYRIHGIARGTVKGDADADIDTYEVEVADPAPPDPPKPPEPGPTPPPPPDPGPPAPPPDPSPFKEAGLRVLIVFESSEASKYPRDQFNTIYGQDFYDELAKVCPKNAAGTPEFRIYDKDVNTAGESTIWQEAMKRPHPQLPWIAIGNGTTGFEGPLPQTKAEIMALIRKYEVKP